MQKGETKNRYLIFIILGIAVLVLVIALAYLIISSYVKQCSDRACFDSEMAGCSKASFVDDTEESTWEYSITGKSGGNCIVNAMLLEIKKGTADLSVLRNKDMDCELPVGYVGNPQDDLTRCHGILKEEMQNLIIKRMHSYILKNIGQISEELTKTV